VQNRLAAGLCQCKYTYEDLLHVAYSASVLGCLEMAIHLGFLTAPTCSHEVLTFFWADQVQRCWARLLAPAHTAHYVLL
jgi:hypothetical protein